MPSHGYRESLQPTRVRSLALKLIHSTLQHDTHCITNRIQYTSVGISYFLIMLVLRFCFKHTCTHTYTPMHTHIHPYAHTHTPLCTHTYNVCFIVATRKSPWYSFRTSTPQDAHFTSQKNTKYHTHSLHLISKLSTQFQMMLAHFGRILIPSDNFQCVTHVSSCISFPAPVSLSTS